MSIRIRYAVIGAGSSTTAEEKDLGNSKWEIVSDGLTKGGTWVTTLAAGATDVQLQIDNLSSINLLVIRSMANDPNDTPVGITVKRNNNGGEAIPIAPLSGTEEGHLVLSTTGLTALYASNPGTIVMKLTIFAAGT